MRDRLRPGKTETPPEEHLLLGDSSTLIEADDAAAARRELERLLAELPDLAARLPDGFPAAAEAYVRLLLEANRRLNLTRVVEPAAVARLHLLDAVAALPLLDRGTPTRVADLGSGGGVPAIPLALARPATDWVLVDSVRKKASALSAFVAALGLRNVRVVAERAEVLGRDRGHRERYDAVTARACAPLPVLVELALPLLSTGGSLLAWKGPLTESDEEVRRGRVAAGQLGAGLLRIEESGIPVLGGHTFVVVPKERPTPARFPRRPGEPSRRPLG
jgi:16S rRNA (guanine527-N7)-methyltransferase